MRDVVLVLGSRSGTLWVVLGSPLVTLPQSLCSLFFVLCSGSPLRSKLEQRPPTAQTRMQSYPTPPPPCVRHSAARRAPPARRSPPPAPRPRPGSARLPTTAVSSPASAARALPRRLCHDGGWGMGDGGWGMGDGYPVVGRWSVVGGRWS